MLPASQSGRARLTRGLRITEYWHSRNRITDNNKCLPLTRPPYTRPSSISCQKSPFPRDLRVRLPNVWISWFPKPSLPRFSLPPMTNIYRLICGKIGLAKRCNNQVATFLRVVGSQIIFVNIILFLNESRNRNI